MENRREEDRKKEPGSDRREVFAFLNVPGLDYIASGARRRVQRRREDQEPTLESSHPLI
jgi:hypothetical protein